MRISLLVAALLMAVRVAHGLHSPLEWGDSISQTAFLLLIPLMINELTQPLRRQG